MKWTTAFFLLVVAQVASAQSALEKALGPEKSAALGIGKLTAQEQSAWLALLRSMGGGNSLGDSAAAYLKAEGWDEVEYVGQARREYKTYAVFRFGFLGEAYAVEAPLMLSLTPGKYFGKVSVLGDQLNSIIDRSGSEHSFLLDKWIKVGR
jgi:hypothetical protein